MGSEEGELRTRETKQGEGQRRATNVVDLRDSEPVENVGHESLKPHVLDSGDELRRLGRSAEKSEKKGRQSASFRPRLSFHCRLTLKYLSAESPPRFLEL